MSIPRSRLRVTLCVLIGLLCLSLPGLSQAQSEQQAVVLLTEEDAARLRLTEEQFEWQVEYHRGTLSQSHGESDQPGPRIDFQSPAITGDREVRTTTPFTLSVACRRNLVAVDENSLKVWARKLGFRKEITDIVRNYWGPDGDGGWRLNIEPAEFPYGRFRIDISIADENGERTVQTYFFWVRRS